MKKQTANKEKDEIKATDPEIIDNAITQVIDTFKFHGIEIKNINLLSDGTPEINVTISKSKRYRDLEDTLNFAYWTLWVLLYGPYDEKKSSSLKLNLNYDEAE